MMIAWHNNSVTSAHRTMRWRWLFEVAAHHSLGIAWLPALPASPTAAQRMRCRYFLSRQRGQNSRFSAACPLSLRYDAAEVSSALAAKATLHWRLQRDAGALRNCRHYAACGTIFSLSFSTIGDSHLLLTPSCSRRRADFTAALNGTRDISFIGHYHGVRPYFRRRMPYAFIHFIHIRAMRGESAFCPFLTKKCQRLYSHFSWPRLSATFLTRPVLGDRRAAILMH